MYFTTPVQTIGMFALALACGYAVWRGGGPERLAASFLFLNWVVTPLLQGQNAFHHAELAIFALDGAFALVLTSIALSGNRFWPLWAAAFQILELVMHLAMLVDHHVQPKAYFIGMEISSYLILLALAVGTWVEGPDRVRRTAV